MLFGAATNRDPSSMIIIIVLRAMLWRVPCAVEAAAPAPRPRRFPWYVHLWGFFLPPWPNYGTPRVRGVSRRRSRR